MNSIIKRKIKFIAIALMVVLLPSLYYLSITIAIDDMNREMRNVTFNNYHNDSLINEALEKTRWAIFLMPWNKEIRSNEVNLLWKKEDYKGALHAAQENAKLNQSAMNYTYEGIAFEYLGALNRAKPSYKKAIVLYEDEFKENPNSDFLISEIALLSMVVGDNARAQEVISNRKNSEDNDESIKIVLDKILQYKSGGILGFVKNMNDN